MDAKDMLAALLKNVSETLGGGGGATEKLTVDKALEGTMKAFMAAGGDKALMRKTVVAHAPRIQALMKALDDGKTGADEVELPMVGEVNLASVGKSDAELDQICKSAEDVMKRLAGKTQIGKAGKADGDGEEDKTKKVKCPECEWEGTVADLEDGKCPECGQAMSEKAKAKKGDTGFGKAKAKLLEDLKTTKAKGKMSDEDKKKFADRMAALRGTKGGKEDPDLKKAAIEFAEVTKSDTFDDQYGGGGWPRDMNDDEPDDKGNGDGK